jgi:hypothetical protein
MMKIGTFKKCLADTTMLLALAVAPAATLSSCSKAQQQHDNGSNAAVGTSLTQAEVRSLRDQFSECWNVDAGMLGLQEIVVEMRVQLDGQGNVRNMMPAGNMPNDPRVRSVFESARRALLSPACNPLRLPPEKYEAVMQSIFRFSPRGLIQIQSSNYIGALPSPGLEDVQSIRRLQREEEQRRIAEQQRRQQDELRRQQDTHRRQQEQEQERQRQRQFRAF